MSKYTTELRTVIAIYGEENVKNWFKDYNMEDYLTLNQLEVIANAGLWNKDKLAEQIINHYYMREIGFDTPYMFKHFAKVKMLEIMEKYLPLIYSNSIEYDPLINVDYTETFERNIDNTSESYDSSSSNASGLTVSSDTPQGQINKQSILNGTYASSTNANENTSSSSGNANGNSNTEENYSKKVKGNSGVSATAQKMIQQYRENIITINKNIIEELSDLFMGLW